MKKDRMATPRDIEEVVRKTFDRIVWDSNICMGHPHIKDTRITVDFIYRLCVKHWSTASIKELYPSLTTEDIVQAIVFKDSGILKSLKDWRVIE